MRARRAAVWKSRGQWISEKGHECHEFKVMAVTQSPAHPDKDSAHSTWRHAMDNALAYVTKEQM